MVRWTLMPVVAWMILGGAAQAQNYAAPAPGPKPVEGMMHNPHRHPAPRIVQGVSPARPFDGVVLPRSNRSDAAYNGGGMVLEQGPDGVTRVMP